MTAFTTEPTGKGTQSWADWPGYGPFVARVLDRTAAGGRQPFAFTLKRDGSRWELEARRLTDDDVAPQAFRVDANAQPTGDALAFERRAPDLYRASGTVTETDDLAFEAGAADLPAAPRRWLVADSRRPIEERQVPSSSGLDLPRIARDSGGTVVDTDRISRSAPPFSSGPDGLAVLALWPWCVLAALLFYLCDLAWRRRPARQA